MNLFKYLPLLLALAVPPLTASAAETLTKPNGKVVLLISGGISRKNQGDVAAFDMAMLSGLPQRSFSTHTPWYPGLTKFSGPLLRDVLAAVGARGKLLKAVALNDYKTDIPFEDVSRFDVILATQMNDKAMPVREKGPLFIVYPYDSREELRSELYYNRSAWQLKSLQVH
ncbi:hypothetical protein VI26_13165 [Chromobacterium sp. LK1]|uniref:molybdopterin-dependent oxidoreductase n=1 Tax=Chromobacterium sp. LK1 TaxID=1628193 RepID=UPI000653D31C|nr:molybdopterin-dependent oxidoreductase [Chromobacterium sp. LK1]KMN34877.1 hypothetical protein VI26_13165 [Chromobacterium sp. LK1]